jgi:hypothetical protein
MSRDTFTIAYDGPALRDGAMDVRDLAPALLALGQLLDAANAALNGDAAQLKLQVRATERGSFQIVLDLAQHWSADVLGFFERPDVGGATNLLAWVLGVPAVGTAAINSLISLTKILRGRSPDQVERLPDNTMRIIFGTETIDVPIELLRLYQDVAVRNAVQKLIDEPLKREGVERFEVRKDGAVAESVSKAEAGFFARPVVPDETLVDETRRSAFSIVSLAFKEDNKWRLFDGNTQISAAIEDQDFLGRVNDSQIAFTKGDILLCDVRVTQRRTSEGLKTDYVVEHVVEHRTAARQIPLPLPSVRP